MKKVVIIGAGPAGLTAAYELLEKNDCLPMIFEMDNIVGGISKTVNYKGNRIDIGGHRFFSKSDKVMNWWQMMMPVQSDQSDIEIKYQNKTTQLTPQIQTDINNDEVLLVRKRLSRIYFLGKLFNYPLSFTLDTLKKMGFLRLIKIGFSYVWYKFFPIKNEKSLQDFFINRFGNVLYKTFFKDYTEKVWGVPTTEISASWGAQRIKGLSLTKTILHALKPKKKNDIKQKNLETSLIENFLYPKYGPGQMWEIVANKVIKKGGQLHFNKKATKINFENNKIKSVFFEDIHTKETIEINADYVISTMPISELVKSFNCKVPENIYNIATSLPYRDFFTVGLLCNKLKISNKDGSSVEDNWIYIQEKGVQIGRLQLFHNWSPYLVDDKTKSWLGLEYFCYATDSIWKMKDEDLIKLATEELVKLNIVEAHDVIDGLVLRVPKTYPSYTGVYDEFDKVKDYINTIDNLFLVGRNGMHKYNNQDHSMLTAMEAAEQIATSIINKNIIWDINTEEEYHESK